MRVILLTILAWTLTAPAYAFEPDVNEEMELDVAKAILAIKRADPGIEAFFENAAGYAVFPSVGKGGLVVGGAYGKGLVIVDDQVDGYTSMTQGTIGLQIGGQKYAQFIFFKDATAIDHFRRGNFEFGAQASAGLEMKYVLVAPILAIPKVLKKEGTSQDEIDLFEINEAFSGSTVAVLRELKLDPARVNVNGGSVALGHPIGASGCRVLVTLLYEMIKQNKKTGLASLCLGGGEAVAMIIKR